MTKKILISDYDNTLYVHYYNVLKKLLVFKYNMLMINTFRKKDNIFILATGRNFESIYHEIMKKKIKFDYLICNDGSEIYDADFNEIYSAALDEGDQKKLLSIDGAQKYYNFSKSKVIAIKYYGLRDELLKIRETLHNNLLHSKIELKKEKLKVINNNSDKYVAFLRLNLSPNEYDIYSIGDDENDANLLKNLNGHTLTSNEHVFDFEISKITSVAQLILKIFK